MSEGLPDTAQLVAELGMELYWQSLHKPLHQRMAKPRPGDLVVETSTALRAWNPDRLGRLLRIDMEEGEKVFVVIPLHDQEREVQWVNASVIALPETSTNRWLADG